MRIRDPRTTALVFASGKMVVTGAKSEDDSRLGSLSTCCRVIYRLHEILGVRCSELHVASD